jgi:predicted N-acetyltransferase YhbS
MEILNLSLNKIYIPIVSEWIYNEFILNIQSGISIKYITNSFNNRKKNKIPLTFIAVKDTICVGTVSIVENDLTKRKDLKPWLAALFVKPEYRNQGLGLKLIYKTIKETKKLGYKKIYLRTETAGAYYKKMNWNSVYKTIDEYGLNTEVYEYTF